MRKEGASLILNFHQTQNSIGDAIFNTRTFENASFFAHFHQSFELILIMEGTLRCTVDGRQYTLLAPQCVLIQPYQIHAWEVKNGKIYICVFSKSYVSAFAKSLDGYLARSPVFTPSAVTAQYFLDTLYREFPTHFNLPLPENPLPIKAALYAMCNEFFKNAELIPTPTQSAAQPTAAILQYITAHFSENISLRTIADALGYSYQHTSRIFNQQINMPFKTFLNGYRFECAKQLLRESRKSITEIAFESGFQSIRNFNLICTQFAGKTPREIREEA